MSGTPSMTYSGWLVAESDDDPRTRTVIPLPGLPAFWITCTPDALPWSAPSSPATGELASSAPWIELTELLTSRRCAVPYPVTTTSVSCAATCRRLKLASAVPPVASRTARTEEL